jgi:hypothetical protein
MDDITLSATEGQLLLETLSAAHNCLWAEDLHETYRKLNRQNRSSPLTLSVEQARDMLAAKLGVEVDDVS